MVFPKAVWLVIAAALLISSIGFKKYVWFISLGYGFSIAGIGILLLALYGGRLTAGTDAWCIVGALIMLFGVCFESAADIQKQKLKKINPKRFCDTGLFRIVRCPNYLGEMLFWTGVLVSGANVLRGWQWLPALLGYLGIVFVMFSGARRLELRQNKSYGADPEYQAYAKSVPILLPFVPLYSVAKYKFLVA